MLRVQEKGNKMIEFQDAREILDNEGWEIIVAGPSKYHAWPRGHREMTQVFFTIDAAIRFITGKEPKQ
jgi:hypothetical protein